MNYDAAIESVVGAIGGHWVGRSIKAADKVQNTALKTAKSTNVRGVI